MMQNAAVQMGTMSWSDLYPMSGNLNPATDAPQTGAKASGGGGVSGGAGISASHWLIGGVIVLVVFRIFWEHQSIRA